MSYSTSSAASSRTLNRQVRCTPPVRPREMVGWPGSGWEKSDRVVNTPLVLPVCSAPCELLHGVGEDVTLPLGRIIYSLEMVMEVHKHFSRPRSCAGGFGSALSSLLLSRCWKRWRPSKDEEYRRIYCFAKSKGYWPSRNPPSIAPELASY